MNNSAVSFGSDINSDDLKDVQERGMTLFGLTKDQVLNPNFDEKILKVMESLHLRNPNAEGKHLYETAFDMPEFQIQGIVENQLTLEQVGIGLLHGNFVQQAPEDDRFSEDTVNAQTHLIVSENMDSTKAYEIALNLDSRQIMEMIDYGFRLEQVQLPNNTDTEAVFDVRFSPNKADQDLQKIEKNLGAVSMSAAGLASIPTREQQSNEGELEALKTPQRPGFSKVGSLGSLEYSDLDSLEYSSSNGSLGERTSRVKEGDLAKAAGGSDSEKRSPSKKTFRKPR